MNSWLSKKNSTLTMKITKLLVFTFLLFPWILRAQDPLQSILKMSALGIPDTLKKDANAVWRLDESVLEVTSPSRYTVNSHQIITLLNKDAAGHLKLRYGIDKFNKLDEVDVKVYNALGMEVRKYKRKDFETVSADDGMSLHTDDQVVRLDVVSTEFPCTLEITTQQRATSYINLPGQYVNQANHSVELFRYVVKVPPELDIRYKLHNLNNKPVTGTEGKLKTYTWEVRNLPVLKTESGGYESLRHYPVIDIAPSQFEYDGHKGDFTSWKSFGAWCYALYTDQNPFSPARAAEIRSLVADCKTNGEKVAVLYDHLKKNMRYVSIQLGIGGFKPFPVSFVDDKKYGDCKALTNYMRYMLKTVNINAWPALINSGYNKVPVDPAFPINRFNHVVLCVPMGKDSVWLECTSNNNACGDLGSSNENKYALLLTDAGGQLIPTPKSKSSQNLLFSKTVITLSKEGDAEVESAIFCTGGFWDIYYSLMQMEKNDLKQVMVNYLDYKSPETFELKRISDSANGNRFTLALAYDQLHDFKAGSKYFFRPRVNRICDEDPKVLADRKTEYLFHYPYEKTDTTIYRLPEGFVLENIPAPRTINTQYGSYKSEVTRSTSDNSFMVVARLVLNYNIIPASECTRVAEFFRDVNKQEAEKIVIRGQ